MRNIAIVGKMYSGKTTLAMKLVDNHGYTRVAMAGPLKKLAAYAYGEVVEKDKEYETIDRETGDAVFKTGRQIMQGIGQSLKYVDRNIWLKIFANDTEAMGSEPYVVDDVRFQFEADYLRSRGWLIVMVETPDEERIRRAVALTGRAPSSSELTHESEAEVDEIAYDVFHRGDKPMEKVAEFAKLIAKG